MHFHDLRQLIQFMKFCPVCKTDDRNIMFRIYTHGISVNCLEFKINNYEIIFSFIEKINGFTNNTTLSINLYDNKMDGNLYNDYYSMLIEGDCNHCKSLAFSNIILFNSYSKYIENVQIHKEYIHLYDSSNKYELLSNYVTNKLIIKKCVATPYGHDILSDPISFDLIDFDFSDMKKVLEKINMLLTFA